MAIHTEEPASSTLAESRSPHIICGHEAFCTRTRLVYVVVWKRGFLDSRQATVIDMFDAFAHQGFRCAGRTAVILLSID